MRYFDEGLNDVDFADEILRALEDEYGCNIARIPYFKQIGEHRFEIQIIFVDFRLLEAEIFVESPIPSMPQIRIEGTFY
jgi:hypothetical protein